VDAQLLKRHCEKAHVAFPAKLSRQITSRQVKDPIYSLALAIRNTQKWFWRIKVPLPPYFLLQIRINCHTILNSYTLYRNPNSRVALRHLKCNVRYFDRICENLDTRPIFLKHLINNISRSFYARENKFGQFHLRHNLSDAYYLAKLLCMLQHQLIANRLFSQLNTLFELTSKIHEIHGFTPNSMLLALNILLFCTLKFPPICVCLLKDS